ncbi:cysteine dioxygenase, partial [Actinomadura adrarensis]
FAVALGDVEERDLAGTRRLTTGAIRSFGPEYVHEVRNASHAPAVTVHAYSPPLTVMNRYDLEGFRLILRAAERVEQR